jgi:hypothetical protein
MAVFLMYKIQWLVVWRKYPVFSVRWKEISTHVTVKARNAGDRDTFQTDARLFTAEAQFLSSAITCEICCARSCTGNSVRSWGFLYQCHSISASYSLFCYYFKEMNPVKLKKIIFFWDRKVISCYCSFKVFWVPLYYFINKLSFSVIVWSASEVKTFAS